MADESPARITRVVLKNFKSIVHCDVELKPLTILVGPNGSGKSNFLDALRFVTEAPTVGLAQAVRNRGNALHILAEGRPSGSSSFATDLGFRLTNGNEGRYSFEIEVSPDTDFRVVREVLEQPKGRRLYAIGPDGASMWAPTEVADRYPARIGDRLYLVAYSSVPEARPVYDLLTSMVFYSPALSAYRQPRPWNFAGWSWLVMGPSSSEPKTESGRFHPRRLWSRDSSPVSRPQMRQSADSRYSLS